MLIAITTYQYNNYGSRLQNYALCQSVRNLGAEAVSLAANNTTEYLKQVIRNTLALLPPMANRQHSWISERIKEKHFHKFNQRLSVKEVSYRKLAKYNAFDLAIAGSDQVWNPGHLTRHPMDVNLFFLTFVPVEKRFSYAASFGVTSIPSEMKDMYRKHINDFNTLSVREQTGKKIIKDLTGREASVVPDPTFLLNREEWIKTAEKSGYSPPQKKYLLVYFLSRQSDDLWKSIRQYADEKDLEIIRIVGNIYRKGDFVPAPDEFIALVNDAEAVFTDSFHGSVLSIILQTPFIVTKRSDVDQFTRIENLLDRFSLEIAFYDKKKSYETIFAGENFSQTNNILNKEREKGLNFLKKIIYGNKANAKN